MTKPRGNPAKRQRGEVVRAVIVALLKPGVPMPLDAGTEACDISRVVVLQHLATLQARGKIKGYTTASMMVRVW